ncbi:MAG: hypothetical protein KDC35_20275 [Acidobacteria bacterium]|nr:hypothetical protein [Acidobacteriota bacterium]
MKWLCVVLSAVLVVGCHRVVIHVDSDGEHLRLSAPYALVSSAIRLNADELVIDDLGGVDATVNLRELVTSLKASDGEASIEIADGDQSIVVHAGTELLRLEITDADTRERVNLYLPMEAIERVNWDENTLSAHDLSRALKGYRGTLLEVNSPGEHVRIELR